MLLPIFEFDKKYRVTLDGQIAKLVVCENCSCEWVYILKRRETGVSSSWMGINSEAALRRARNRAKRHLHEKLALDCEIIACPQCGWYQPDMRSKYRENSLKRLAVVVSAVLLLIAFVYPAAQDVIASHPRTWMVLWIAIACAIAVAAARIWVSDPNANAELRVGKSPRAVLRSEFEKVNSASTN